MDYIILNQPRVVPHKKYYSIIKKVMDYGMCILLLPFALPIMAICAIAIYIDDPKGPVFLFQERIGKGGRPFKMYKFRTMKINADDPQSRAYMKAYVRGELRIDDNGNTIYKPISSNKIFRIGRLLRKISLDELPQIFNVLKGEMSIVGPRPNVPWEVEEYRPWHYERLEVLPGITGLAQVRGRSSINFNSLARYDIAYIENRSIALDLKILFRSLKAIIIGNGAK
ncbi:MAG: sugar transferase [Anaerolineaceae bacterium]|nr:sugar transferase [Anaerolineaceae bacterium]